MKEKVLIVSTNKFWTGISRLPGGLSRAGFDVYAVCPKNSFISYTRHLKDALRYPTFSYSRSKLFYLVLFYSFFKYDPDIVLPGDEEALLILKKFQKFLNAFSFLKRWKKIIASSLPESHFDSVLLSKSAFMAQCDRWGIPAPKNFIVQSLEEAHYFAKYLGYPVVLKLDEGYGGSGVFICEDQNALEASFHRAMKIDRLLEFKYSLKKLFFISLFEKRPKISVQQFIEGLTGHVPFCAREGKLLAANPMLKVETYPGRTGPTSVSSGINHPELIEYVRKLVSKLKYAGFGAIDFMLDEKTNEAFVIELNPRPTPSCHFSSELVTYDLCEAFYKRNALPPKNFKPFTVAMFPNEKKRDPNSPYIRNSYYDVPFDDPFLLKALDT